MNAKQLLEKRDNYRWSLIDDIMDFVRENGDDCDDYEINEFGLDEEEYGEGKVTKVYNFFDNGGCYFFESSRLNSHDCDGMTSENYYDKLYAGVDYTAYICLYIVDTGETEHLKYYRFINGGIEYDSDQSEPEHDDAYYLSLLDLEYIIQAIINIEDGKQNE